MARRQPGQHFAGLCTGALEYPVQRLGKKHVLGFEVGIETAMREPRLLHHVGDGDLVGTVLPQSPRGDLQNPLAGFLFVVFCVAHACSPPGTDYMMLVI
jgi:hypothetical protein